MTELKRVLGFKTILLITINSIMGTGIYFLPAVGAKYGGPASIISWIIMSFIAIYIGACFAELCSMFPKAGGVYEYCKQVFGRFPSFLIGWLTLVAGNLTIAMLVVGAIQYLLPYPLPFIKIVSSLFFILAFNYIAFKGMKISSFMLVTFSLITLGLIAALVIPGLFHINPANFKPFFIFPTSTIFITLFFIAETFFGWESATFLAEETKNPEKVMPKALILGTISIAVMSLLIVIVSMGVMPWNEFGLSKAPLSALGSAIFGTLGKDIFTLWVYLAIVGAVACWVVSAPRLILALSRDRLFFSQFAKIHPKYNTPHRAIILQTIVISLLVLRVSGEYRLLLLLLIPAVLLMYSSVMASLVILRYKKPELKRPFKVPFGKIGPLLLIAFFIFLVTIWVIKEPEAIKSLFLGLSFILIGIPVYFLVELYYNPRFARWVDDFLAYFTLLTEKFALPKKIRKEIINLLGNIKGKVVLEFGASVGTLTLHLAEQVGKDGKVYATDYSKQELNIMKKRLEKRGQSHVTVIHDDLHHSRVHPDIPDIHTIVSIGMLGYLKDTHRVLKDMNKRLKIGRKICFVDYDKFFDIIPNVEWLADDKKIKKLFENTGFRVAVLRKQGFAWRYVFIYGTKVRNVK